MENPIDVTKLAISGVNKLLDILSDFFGKAYEPRYIKKMADARAYEISKIGDALRETGDIPISYNKGDISMDTSDYDALVQRAGNRLARQELKKQENLERIIGTAYDILEAEQESVSSEPVDSDWINRFFGLVQDISNEEMQKLWARLLAGEVKRPNTFSLRTLDILRNMSQQEAILIQNATNDIIIYDDEYLIPEPNFFVPIYKNDTNYGDIMTLDECGLINSTAVSSNIPIKNKETAIARNNNLILVASEQSRDMSISLDYYRFTRAGNEILSLCDNTMNDEKFISYAKQLTHEYPNIKFSVYKLYSDTECTRYDDSIDLLNLQTAK